MTLFAVGFLLSLFAFQQSLSFQISIMLRNRTVMFSLYKEKVFPDVEKIFKVQGSDVEILQILNTEITTIDPEKLGKLRNLTKLVIKRNKRLQTLPPFAFEKNKEIASIQLVDNAIETMSMYTFDGVFTNTNLHGEIYLTGNQLKSFPTFKSDIPGLKYLYLDQNPITSMEANSLKKLFELQKLRMRKTGVKYIADNTFQGAEHLIEFDISGSSKLKTIGKNAFNGAKRLKILRLDDTQVSFLPSAGLTSLETLSFKGVSTIWSVPDGILNLPKLRYVFTPVERRFLCCAFLYKRQKSLPVASDAAVNVTRICSPTTSTNLGTTQGKTSTPTSKPATTSTKPSETNKTTTEDPWGSWGRKKRSLLWFDDSWEPSNWSTLNNHNTGHHLTDDNFGKHTATNPFTIFHCQNITNGSLHEEILAPVECYPAPDALRPCDDIMGDVALTTISWIVSFLAILGNGFVFGILVMSRRHFPVTKFLIMNLAFADLCLGLYLFVLTCASIDTTGEYYNYVVNWQYNGGCDVTGFLAIFSSELSMLVLTLITIERYFAIVYAVYLQKRLKMRQAWMLVVGSWIISLILAVLPLTGVNNFREVAICLPFSISSVFDKAYVGFVLIFNSVLFCIVLACYVKIYMAVAGSNRNGHAPSQANDSAVAKRIALLVFTDFACWIPIAIVGIIAATGNSSSINMSVEKSKYLLVIFFPINSVCNPFLYALSTKTFRREFYTVFSKCSFCRKRLHRYQSNTYSGHSSHRKADKKVRRNTETVTLEGPYSVAPVDLRTTSMGTKKTNVLSQQANLKPNPPGSNLGHPDRNSNFSANDSENKEAYNPSENETSFTESVKNEGPVVLLRNQSTISNADPTAPLCTDRNDMSPVSDTSLSELNGPKTRQNEIGCQEDFRL